MASSYLAPIKRQLEVAGFFVEEDYECTVASLDGSAQIFRIALAAFLRYDRRDIKTIAVVAQDFSYSPLTNPFIPLNRHLAPNLQLAVTPDHIEWWVPKEENRPIRVTHFSDIEEDFIRYQVVPEEMRIAREGLQASLFSLLPDALDYARAATSKVVAQRFNEALQTVIKVNGLPKLTAVGLDLLAAIILDDKRAEIGLYSEQQSASNPRDALSRAKTYFPKSFKDTPDVSEEVLEAFWRYLRTDMSYRGMSPDDLSDLLSSLYEGVLLSRDQRRLQGSYYTPRDLAKRVLEHMPIEEIAPEDRIVLDGACGSGNLLRVAGDHLKQLRSSSSTMHQHTDYLSQRLLGIDKDAFAVNIARKAMLLANLPYDRNWMIYAHDFLTAEFSSQPSIIIANPPFKGVRSRGGGEYAIEFVTRYMEMLRPGGLMGIFLPAPLLQNPSEAQFRRDLLEFCSILEMWMLPEKSIPSSNLGIAVLILIVVPLIANLSSLTVSIFLEYHIDTSRYGDMTDE